MGVSQVFLDSNLFIYLFEDAGPRGQRAEYIIRQLVLRQASVLTSTLTFGEVLVKPVETGNRILEQKYRTLLDAPTVTVLPFDRKASEIFAVIRQNRAIKAPDAIQLSSAASAGCDLFITNDERLSRTIVPGIQFIVSMDRAPL